MMESRSQPPVLPVLVSILLPVRQGVLGSRRKTSSPPLMAFAMLVIGFVLSTGTGVRSTG